MGRRAPESRVSIDRLKTRGKSRADAADAKNSTINDGDGFFFVARGIFELPLGEKKIASAASAKREY